MDKVKAGLAVFLVGAILILFTPVGAVVKSYLFSRPPTSGGAVLLTIYNEDGTIASTVEMKPVEKERPALIPLPFLTTHIGGSTTASGKASMDIRPGVYVEVQPPSSDYEKWWVEVSVYVEVQVINHLGNTVHTEDLGTLTATQQGSSFTSAGNKKKKEHYWSNGVYLNGEDLFNWIGGYNKQGKVRVVFSYGSVKLKARLINGSTVTMDAESFNTACETEVSYTLDVTYGSLTTITPKAAFNAIEGDTTYFIAPNEPMAFMVKIVLNGEQ